MSDEAPDPLAGPSRGRLVFKNVYKCRFPSPLQGGSEADAELRAATGGVAEPEVEAVLGEDVADQGEAQAAAVPLGAEEGSEEERLDVRGDVLPGYM